MSMSSKIESGLHDAQSQISDLRAQMDRLMSDRVGPRLHDAAGQAGSAVRQVREMAGDKATVLSQRVRGQPLAALAIAIGVGYVLGRVAR